MPEITYGEATRLSPRLRRVTAPNSGRMTGPGTNTYIIGDTELAVVDPGPLINSHLDALVRICGDRLRWVLVTHTHRDHSPAAYPLAARTGAKLIGNVIANDGFQDETFVEAQELAQDDCLRTDEFTLRALLTPGHVSNHICYLLEEDHILITGDHIMGGSTVVIVPPAGNMKDYIESLERMLEYSIGHIAPGHGDLIGEPEREIRHLIAHRLKRERKVFDALAASNEPLSVVSLTPIVYDDVDPVLHEWAARSLLAHLIKLGAEGRARCTGARWSIASL